MKKTAFIVGSGYVGSVAADLFKLSNYQVWSGRRTAKGGTDLSLDVLRPESFPKELLQAEIVIYCVAADASKDEAYRLAYVEGLKNVLTALEQESKKLTRFIFVSSTGVYAQNEGEEIDEDSLTSPTNFSGIRLLEGEALLKALGSKATAVRFSGIYGPGREGIIQEVTSGREFAAQRLDTYSNRIHRDDCARLLLFLSETKQLKPIYIGSDRAPALTKEIVNWLGEKLSYPIKNYSVKISQNLEGGVRARGNKRCSSALICLQGFEFIYPTYKEGFSQILADRA